MTDPYQLSRRLRFCVHLAGEGVSVDRIRELDCTKRAREAGWPVPSDGMLREKPDRFELYDVTKEAWIPLKRSKRKLTYSAKDLTEWSQALNRMYGYALPRPPKPAGRPKGDRLNKQVAFVKEAKELAASSDVSLNSAMLRLAKRHGFKESEFGACREAFRRQI